MSVKETSIHGDVFWVQGAHVPSQIMTLVLELGSNSLRTLPRAISSLISACARYPLVLVHRPGVASERVRVPVNSHIELQHPGFAMRNDLP
jgi:hypothetical protein